MAAEGDTLDNEMGGDDRAVVLNTKPLFKLMVDKRASDLFFTSYAPIKIKIEGQIFPVNKQMLTPEVVRQAAYGLMTQEQIDAFNDELEIDFAISEPGLGRFRVNVFKQRGEVGMVIRAIRSTIPTIEELQLPQVLKDIIMAPRGLVLIAGSTGAGIKIAHVPYRGVAPALPDGGPNGVAIWIRGDAPAAAPVALLRWQGTDVTGLLIERDKVTGVRLAGVEAARPPAVQHRSECRVINAEQCSHR